MATKTLENRLEEFKSSGATERAKALEVVTRRLAKRRLDKISGILLPFPLTGCQIPDSSGVVFRALLPVDGTLIRAVVDIDAIGEIKGGVMAVLELSIGDDLYYRRLHVRKPCSVFKLELPAITGTRVKMSVPSEVQHLVWTGLLFLPETSSGTIKRIIMEDYKDAEETGAQASS